MSPAELLEKELQRREKKMNKIFDLKNILSVKTSQGEFYKVKEIVFENGQVFKMTGPLAERWPVNEYERKKKGLLF